MQEFDHHHSAQAGLDQEQGVLSPDEQGDESIRSHSRAARVVSLMPPPGPGKWSSQSQGRVVRARGGGGGGVLVDGLQVVKENPLELRRHRTPAAQQVGWGNPSQPFDQD